MVVFLTEFISPCMFPLPSQSTADTLGCQVDAIFLYHKAAVIAGPVNRNACSGVTLVQGYNSNKFQEMSRFPWATFCENTVIPRLTKIIRSGITFVSRNVISSSFL